MQETTTELEKVYPAISAGVYMRIFSFILACRRGHSVLVRQNIALEMKDWWDSWGHSLLFVFIDTLWNTMFVVDAGTLLWISYDDTDFKVTVWIFVYALQCVLHVILVWFGYWRRSKRLSLSSRRVYILMRKLEWYNTMITYIWCAIGILLMMYSCIDHDTGRLIWLTLATDVSLYLLHMVFFIFISAAYCFCLPQIIAFMYYVCRQEFASGAAIGMLPKYIYGCDSDIEQPGVRACRLTPMRRNSPEFSSDHFLALEDTFCCLCLRHYEDGDRLHLLYCKHHFHSKCITRWLQISKSIQGAQGMKTKSLFRI